MKERKGSGLEQRGRRLTSRSQPVADIPVLECGIPLSYALGSSSEWMKHLNEIYDDGHGEHPPITMQQKYDDEFVEEEESWQLDNQ